MLLLRILSGMESTISFQIATDAVMVIFQVLVKIYFLNVRHALLWLSVGCTGCSFSPNIAIFNNILVFNFPFFNFEQKFNFLLDNYSLFIFDVVLQYQVNASKIPKMV